MKKSYSRFLAAFIALGSLFFNSCVEKDVDLTNIDGTTSVQTSLFFHCVLSISHTISLCY